MEDRRAHGAPLERGMIIIESYKHRAPLEHWAYDRQGTNHLKRKANQHSECQLFAAQRDQWVDFRGAARWKVTRKQGDAN